MDSWRDYYKALYFPEMNFSPHDYGCSGKLAGAMYAISEIKDAIPVIHGSAGCGFHYKYICRRGYLPAYNAKCTNLEEKDIVFGGEDKLKAAIRSTAERYSPSMIAVIPAAPVDMIHAEMEAVVADLKNKVNCKLIIARSEKFSHVDKRNRSKIYAQRAESWNNQKPENKFEFNKGCGFAEAMTAIVEQVMVRQQVRKNTVNICGLAWGSGGNAVAGGLARDLKLLGIGLNTYLPNCRTNELVEAPGAELNIVTRRIPWAKRMEDIFGTKYLHIDSFDSYRGPEGIEKLFLEIAGFMENKNGIERALKSLKEKTLQDIKPVKEYFKKFSFALYTSSYGNIPYIIDEYAASLDIPLKFICVEMDGKDWEADCISEETREKIIGNIRNSMERAVPSAQLFINAPDETLKEIFTQVDYVFGDGDPIDMILPDNYIQTINRLIPLDFQSYKKMAENMAGKIKKAGRRGRLLTERFNANLKSHSSADYSNMDSSRKMWEEMWLRRG